MAFLEGLVGSHAAHPAKQKSPAMGHSSDANHLSIGGELASNGAVSSTPRKHSGADSINSTTLTPLTAKYHKFAVRSQWLLAVVLAVMVLSDVSDNLLYVDAPESLDTDIKENQCNET